MKKTIIRCSECGKVILFTNTSEDNRGKIAYEVQHKGYIAKLPALYGYSNFEFFCSKECTKKWYSKIPEDVRQRGDEVHRQLSDTMNSEDFKRGLQKGLTQISKLFKRRLK